MSVVCSLVSKDLGGFSFLQHTSLSLGLIFTSYMQPFLAGISGFLWFPTSGVLYLWYLGCNWPHKLIENSLVGIAVTLLEEMCQCGGKL